LINKAVGEGSSPGVLHEHTSKKTRRDIRYLIEDRIDFLLNFPGPGSAILWEKILRKGLGLT
jgi:hypothetical protein